MKLGIKLGNKTSSVLRVTSPIPPSVNHYMGYRAILQKGKPLAVPYKTPEAKAYQKVFADTLKKAVKDCQWPTRDNPDQHFYVDATFYFPRKRMDCNNYWKVMLDTITETKLIWDDDDVVCERAQAIYYDSDNPRVELTIRPVDYIGVFKDASQLEEFESNCIACAKYSRNCSILRQAKEGRVQKDIENGACQKFKPKPAKSKRTQGVN